MNIYRRVKGVKIMLDIKMETAEEKQERIFNHYKNILITEVRNASGNENIRFNCIEYLCSFPKIDPFVMAANITKEGITILYDDSSISIEENNAKERKVKRLLV